MASVETHGVSPPPSRHAPAVRARRLPARRELAACWAPLWEGVGSALAGAFVEVLHRHGPADRAPVDLLKGRAPTFAAEYRQALHDEFELALNDYVAPAASGVSAGRRAALKLIEYDEMELATLVERGAAHIRNLVDEAYMPLKLRVAGMSGEVDLRDGECPFRPAVFFRAVRVALEKLGIDPPDCRRLLVRFDRPLVPVVSAAYHAVDRHLSDKGHAAISPFDGDARSVMMRRLRRKAVVHVEQSASDRERYPAPVAALRPHGDAERILEALYQRLQLGMPAAAPGDAASAGQSAAKPQSAAPRATAGLPQAAVEDDERGSPTVPAATAPDPALVEAINGVQKLAALSLAAGGDGSAAPEGALDTAELRRRIADKAVRPMDKLTIEIVGLLFERIERDRHVPERIKELLGRLQFPLIKSALADPELFVAADRPARRLIDRISSTAVGWSPDGQENQRYLTRIERAVNGVLCSVDDAGPAFEQALAEIENYLAEERAAEQDPVARAKRALAAAETREVMAINATIKVRSAFDGAQIDPYLREFLLDIWVRVLVAAALRPGGGPPAMERYLAVVPDLLWSVQPKVEIEDRQRMIKAIPPMLAQLREGLALIAWPTAQAEAFFARLLASHAQAVRGLELAHGLEPPPPAPQEIRDRLKGLELYGATVLPEAQSHLHVSDDVVRQVLAVQQVDVHHIGIPSGAPPADTDLSDAQLDAFIHAWRLGDWFTLQLDGAAVRVRLRWISPQKTLYLFSAADGGHPHSLSPDGIRARLRTGELLPAEPAPLFERAVQGVMVDLQGAVDTMPPPR